MNSNEKYLDLLASFKNAIQSFGNSLQIVPLQFDEIVVDTIKSGQIQKFKISTEIAWKCCKLYIELNFGELVASPKLVYKQLFLNEVVDETLYLQLIDTIEDRNKLSHIYKEQMFNTIYQNLQHHYSTLQAIFSILHAE